MKKIVFLAFERMLVPAFEIKDNNILDRLKTDGILDFVWKEKS